MIIGTGIDLVKIERLKQALARWEGRFERRVFTPAEQAYAARHKEPALHLAGRFAVKESVLKALGIGWRQGVRWVEMEVLPDAHGRPTVKVSGQVKALMEARGVTAIHASISHDSEYAIGHVLLISEPRPQVARGRRRR